MEGRSEDVTKSLEDRNKKRPEAKEARKLVMRADVVEKELAKENDCAATEEAEEEEDDEEEPEKVYSSANMDEGAAGRQSL